jgi:thiopeptide-type bacteriocin biosynthesis protein
LRWWVALRGLEALIDDFSGSFDDKRAVVARRRRDYRREFNAEQAPLKRHLGDRFRANRDTLQIALSGNTDMLAESAAFKCWNDRSLRVRPIVDQLRGAENASALWSPLTAILDSYLHMFVNRVTRANGRVHELVMFEFLGRYLESMRARASVC